MNDGEFINYYNWRTLRGLNFTDLLDLGPNHEDLLKLYRRHKN